MHVYCMLWYVLAVFGDIDQNMFVVISIDVSGDDGWLVGWGLV